MNKQIGHIHWEKVRVSHKVPPVYMKDGEVTIDIPFKLYEYVDESILTEKLRTAISKQLQSKGIPIYVDSDSLTFESVTNRNQLRWLKYKIYHIEKDQMKAINQWIVNTWNQRFLKMSPQIQKEEMVKWDQSTIDEIQKLLIDDINFSILTLPPS